jgi:hypothetical protein
MIGIELSDREEADTYCRELWRRGRLRVVVCRSNLQWIVQRRRGAFWRGFWYCTSRKGLERICNALQGADRAAYLAWVTAQPDRFPQVRLSAALDILAGV